MSEEEYIKISNNIHEQRNEKRKKKKRRGKILNAPEESKENMDEYNAPLTIISSIITGETNKLPIEENPNLLNAPIYQKEEKMEQESTKLKKRKKRGRKEEKKEEKKEDKNLKEEKEEENNEEKNLKEEKEEENNEKENLKEEKEEENNEEENLKEEKEEENNDKKKKENSEDIFESKKLPTMKQKITPKELNEEEIDENEKPEEINENEKKVLRDNMNKHFKRAINLQKDDGGRIKDDNNKGIIPSKDINPNELLIIDEDDDELDYLKAQKAYELSVFLDSHKFIKNNKKFDEKFSDLLKRKLIRFERNMLDLVDNNKFFILYELQVSEHINLDLTDLITLNAIKSILISFPNIHLIIIISDEELYNKSSDKYDYSLIKEFAKEKLANIIIFLNLDLNTKRIHAFSIKEFKTINNELEKEKNQLKEIVDKQRLGKLYNLTKEEQLNDLLLDYPCYLAISTNPSIYTDYIPEINSDYKCLIINSIYYMNRYLLCFDAAKVLGYNEPVAIALKLVPHLNGFKNLETYGDYDEENTILSSDENFSLNKKMEKLANESNGRNPNIDVACQYLGFLEEDNDNYYNMIKNYEEEKDDRMNIINRVHDLLIDLLKIFKEKDINDIDINKFLINLY